jgi:hypothetical protein
MHAGRDKESGEGDGDSPILDGEQKARQQNTESEIGGGNETLVENAETGPKRPLQ